MPTCFQPGILSEPVRFGSGGLNRPPSSVVPIGSLGCLEWNRNPPIRMERTNERPIGTWLASPACLPALSDPNLSERITGSFWKKKELVPHDSRCSSLLVPTNKKVPFLLIQEFIKPTHCRRRSRRCCCFWAKERTNEWVSERAGFRKQPKS